jgi:hypothetical protein
MFCVVSHDAGGAEIISSLIRHQGWECQYVLAGPAVKIFQRKLGPIDSELLKDAIHSADWFLCGTSWQSDLEWQAIALAKEAGKRTVAFLDHWVNYQERFVRGGETHLPDEIWIGDVLAENMARNLFPGLVIRLVENPYFVDLKREFDELMRLREFNLDSLRVLYVCEPLREHALREYGNERHWGYTEEEALRYFLANLEILGAPIGRIVIRPHPSEAPDKYDWASEEYNLPISSGGARTLIEEVSACDVVVGCESMAMVVGLLAGRRVISCIPPGGKPCALPQPEIESMQQLLMSKTSHVL